MFERGDVVVGEERSELVARIEGRVLRRGGG
jgi:hypothetical protein